MPRKPRLDYPGAIHHVMNRGARREALFADRATKQAFLRRLSHLPARFNIEVHAFVVMPNHFHLLVKSVHGTLGAGMKWLGQTVTQDINRQPVWDGPVFRGRYRNRIVQSDAYYRHLVAYLHLNPVPGIVASPVQYAWSSARSLCGAADGPEWLSTSAIDDAFSGTHDLIEYTASVQAGRRAPPASFREDVLWEGGITGYAEHPSGEQVVDGLRWLSANGHTAAPTPAVCTTARVVLARQNTVAAGAAHGLSRSQAYRSVSRLRPLLASGTELRDALEKRLHQM